MSKELKEIFLDLQKSEKIVSIYDDISEGESFYAGYIDSVTDTGVRLQGISTNGVENGYSVHLFEDIFQVNYGGVYEKKIEFLVKNRSKLLESENLSNKENIKDFVDETLREAKDKNLFVKIVSNNCNVGYGFVQRVTPEFVELTGVDDSGEKDNTSFLKKGNY